jgi:hypothetical protein
MGDDRDGYDFHPDPCAAGGCPPASGWIVRTIGLENGHESTEGDFVCKTNMAHPFG